ncbi:MAG: DciA family protein [Candidatus Accumulibacter sp. UW26]|jgi:hypothetical protein
MPDLLQKYLDTAEGADKVMAHARQLVRLAGIYREIAPQPLAEASRVANYKSAVLVIQADNGAVAAKLRQMAPTLVRELLRRGLECTGVQVKVQARPGEKPTRVPEPRPLSAKASQEIAALSASLPASPLREALENLLARSARQE